MKRLEFRVALTITVFLSVIGIWPGLRGFGPFAGSKLDRSLPLLQTFMGLLAGMSLLALAAMIWRRRRAENELGRSHWLARAIIEGATDAVFVKDLQGRYLMMNRAGAQFLGKRVEEVL